MKGFNYGLGATASAVLLAVLVIAAELSEPLKSLLKATFTHHWVGKGVIIAVAFVAAGILFKGKESCYGISSERLGWYKVLGSLAAIFLFFAAEFFT